MENISIMGIVVDKRIETAPNVQEVLTKYGDSILSRVGVHDPGEKEHGLITLNVRDEKDSLKSMVHELEELEGVTVKLLNMK